MHITAASAVAILAFASTAVAESPVMKMSHRNVFGLMRRQDNSGAYEPQEASCNDGNTCAEACGPGFETCASTDSSIHCFNKGGGQVCCPSDAGNSCEKGYYCAAGPDKAVVCCPEGSSLTDCAAKQGVTGALNSLTAAATTSTTTTTTTTSASTTPTTTTTSTTTTPLPVVNTTIYLNLTSTSCTSTISGSATFAATNTTTTTKGPSPVPAAPSNTTGPKAVPAGAAGLTASAMAAVVGVAFAALML